MQLVVTFNDGAFSAFASKLQALGLEGQAVMAGALNAAGAEIRSATVAAETKQTGLKQDVLERAQHAHEAGAGGLSYTISATGGDINLKYFGAKETGGGVSAHPFNKSTFFPGAFITSGPKGHRQKAARLNGQVFVNVSGGAWRGKIEKQKSGVFIPKELTTGQTASAFEAGAAKASEYVVQRLGSMLP